MMKLSYRIRGEAAAEIFGVFPEAAVNRAIESGIALRRVKALDGQTIRCALDEENLENLRAICDRCQCELRLLSLRGGSRDRKLLRRRVWLPLTALIMAGLLCVSSLFVWDVEIYGNERVSRGEIERALQDAGLRRGCFWPSLETDLVRSKTLCRLPSLAWLGVNVNGSRAVVLVQERAEKPEIYVESAACDLVASRTGIVRRVSVLNGKALVQPGSTVLEGETLVSGAPENLMGTARLVRARAEVWADTWYELTAVCPQPESQKGEAGWKRQRFALVIGENRINFYGKSRKMLDGYDKIVHEYQLGVSGLFALPISLVCETVIPHRAAKTQPFDPAETEARLEAYLQSRIRGEIVSRSFSAVERDGAVYVTLRAQCYEDIARVQETTTEAEAPSP